MSVTLAEKTVVDKILSEGGARQLLEIDRRLAEEEAKKILVMIKEYDSNIASFEEVPVPVIITRLSKAIIYIIPLPKSYTLTGIMSTKIVEPLLPYLERIMESKRRAVLIFFSKKGKLTMAAYLYLGSVIENHQIGVLFINGDYDEVAEVLWHLENAGKYEAPEDEIIELAGLRE